MLESMTGFGKAEKQSFDKRIVIEIKALNSKQFDLNLRLPSFYREMEGVFRKMIAENLFRGKIDCDFYMEKISVDRSFVIDKKIVRFYMDDLKAVSPGFEEIDYLKLAMRLPEVLNKTQVEIDAYEFEEIEGLISEALAAVRRFRADEGKILRLEFVNRIGNILKFLDQIRPLERDRRNYVRKKLHKAFDQTNLQIDVNRFEQELIYYLEKCDVTEEMLRLKNHCDYFLETLEQSLHPGKKLGFIIQEIGREMTTLGSKAQHSEIQKIVVQMKDELEKIREQLLNIL